MARTIGFQLEPTSTESPPSPEELRQLLIETQLAALRAEHAALKAGGGADAAEAFRIVLAAQVGAALTAVVARFLNEGGGQ